LAAIDADINRLQVAYLNTILLSPIFGTITGVYKNPGDLVRAGEPVFRIENDDTVLIVANVVCRGRVLIGSTLSITTTLFDGTDSPVSVSATIVAARGRGDDDQWEVIGKVSNIDATGHKIFPLGYRFDIDKEITQVSIV
jgi:multidrug resistance efflux pump